MRLVGWDEIVCHLEEALWELNIYPTPSLHASMNRVLETETGPARDMAGQVLENYQEAGRSGLPLCQDTGMVCIDMTVGQEVRIIGGSLVQALNEGIRRAYVKNHLRSSILSDPLFGNNTGDNTPGVYSFDIVPGEIFQIHLVVKGGGCDNLSHLAMCEPGSGVEGVVSLLRRVMKRKAGQACPPLVVGVGIGGSASSVMHVAHTALSRPLGSCHPDTRYRRLEEEWKEQINNLGIGPQGVGGNTTCLEVRIEGRPCHIASFPVGIVASCHVFRQRSLEW